MEWAVWQSTFYKVWLSKKEMAAVTAIWQTRQHFSHKTKIKKQSRKMIPINCYPGTTDSLFVMMEIDILPG